MKILVLNGSPKKKSDTFKLTDAFLKGLKQHGEHTINIINVIDKNTGNVAMRYMRPRKEGLISALMIDAGIIYCIINRKAILIFP